MAYVLFSNFGRERKNGHVYRQRSPSLTLGNHTVDPRHLGAETVVFPHKGGEKAVITHG